MILRLTSPVLCLAYSMKIRTLLLMVAEKTSKLQGCPFFKSHRGAIPCIVCENEISNQRVLSKAKSATRTNMENLCIGRRLLRVCDEIYALVDVYYVCVTCLSFDVIGC